MKNAFILLLVVFVLTSCSGYLGKYSVDYMKLYDGTEIAVDGNITVYESKIEFSDMDTEIGNSTTIVEKEEEPSGCYFTLVDKRGNKGILFINDYKDEAKLMDTHGVIATFRIKKNIW